MGTHWLMQDLTHQIFHELKVLPTKLKSLSIEELDLKEVDQDRFIVKFEVGKNCQLKQFIKSLGLAYEKGCVFYQLTHDETISKDKELIFMKVFTS